MLLKEHNYSYRGDGINFGLNYSTRWIEWNSRITLQIYKFNGWEDKSMEIGDIVSFGSFEWHVLDIMDDRILILTKDISELRDYHNKSENITWKDWLRHYLNESFYNSFEERDRDPRRMIIEAELVQHFG